MELALHREVELALNFAVGRLPHGAVRLVGVSLLLACIFYTVGIIVERLASGGSERRAVPCLQSLLTATALKSASRS